MRFLSIFALTLLAAFPAMADETLVAAPPADSDSGFANVDLDGDLTGRVVVLSAASGRTDTDLLSIAATLKNITGHTVTFEAQTIYRDTGGNWINGGRAGWLAFELKPHGQFEYRSASLTDDAHDFLVRIRLKVSDRMNLVGATRVSAPAVP